MFGESSTSTKQFRLVVQDYGAGKDLLGALRDAVAQAGRAPKVEARETKVANLPTSSRPNLVEVGALNDIDRRVLREALRVGKRLQQRMELDYLR